MADAIKDRQQNRLPTRRRDKRPALAALALLLVLVGALGSALIAYRSGQRTDVLVAARDIPAGHRVTADDLTVARVAADEASVADAGSERAYIGSYATTTVPKGTLVNGKMFRAGGVVPDNAQLVGVVVPQTQLPPNVETGSVVSVFFVQGKAQSGSDDSQPSGTVVLDAARVVSSSSAGGDNGTVLTLLVPSSKASEMVAYAANNQLAVTVLPDGTKPTVDLLSAQ